MQSLLRSAVVLALMGAGAVQAATVTVTSVSNSSATNTWYRANLMGGSTVAAITTSNPRNGNGSVEMSSNGNSAKADYVYTWGYVPARTLGNLNVVGLDWFRAAGTSAAHFAPAMRLYYDADGDARTSNDVGYLIWEQVYNGPTQQNQWVSSNLESQFFWQRQLVPGYTVQDFDMTLANWASGMAPNANNVASFDRLSASTAILGIEFGIGSGWNGTFRGFIDNVRIGFVGEEATTFNFETAGAQVPEPASLALLSLGALGFAARRRKQK